MKRPIDPLTIELARKLLGYRSHPMRESAFGRDVGYPGSPWSGSFIHELLREAGLLETSVISTAAALGWYAHRNRLFTEEPQPGDLVFFQFPSLPGFEQPHVGLVTETVHFKDSGTFRAIEGETASGLNRGSQDRDGVFERVRYEPDVLAFVRPREPRPLDLTGLSEDVPTLRPSNFSKRSPARETATGAVQLALFDATGAGKFVEGEWDGLTRSAFSAFLRTVGQYEPVGDLPTDWQLQLLGDLTLNRYFKTPEIPGTAA